METINTIKYKVLENLSEKYHLTEDRGQISINWKKTKIYFINCAILEIYVIFFPMYILIRDLLQEAIDTISDKEIDDEQMHKANISIAPLIAKLLYTCIDHNKTDAQILFRKMNNEKKDTDHAQFLIDIIQTIDYVVNRGQELQNMMHDAIESGDADKINELNKKDILPYDLSDINADSNDPLSNSVKEKFINNKIDSELFDLRNMRIIGEA